MNTSAPLDTEPFLVRAYQSEILGEAFFALLAEIERDDAGSMKWRLLERLARHVKERLGEELERLGFAPAEASDKVEEGRRKAVALAKAEQENTFVEGVGRYLEEIGANAHEAPGNQPEIARLLRLRAQALLDFADSESKGNADASGDAVNALLEEMGASEEAPIPAGVRLTPLYSVFREDPFSSFDLLRRRAPVHRDRRFRRVILTRHDDVTRVMRDPTFWVDGRKSSEETYRQAAERKRDRSMLGLDDPEHKRLRSLVSRSFTPRQVESWRPLLREIAGELLDEVDRQGDDEFDLVSALAGPLPAIAIARLLGIDPAKQADFKTWSEVSVEVDFNRFASDELKAAAREARDGLETCFREEIRRRKDRPTDDLIGRMVTAEEGGDRLSDQEVLTMCDLLLVAGNVTTSDLIGSGVKALLEHSGQFDLLRERPDLLPNAVEEMLRYDPPITMSVRIAPRDIEIGGVPIRKGESITAVLASANRDPDAYPDPDRFDVAREDTHHVAFGGGVHLCLGIHLARVEAQEAFRALVSRYPNLRPSPRGYEYKQVPGFRGLSEYWVCKSPLNTLGGWRNRIC